MTYPAFSTMTYRLSSRVESWRKKGVRACGRPGPERGAQTNKLRRRPLPSLVRACRAEYSQQPCPSYSPNPEPSDSDC